MVHRLHQPGATAGCRPGAVVEQINEYYSHYGKGRPFDATAETARGMIEAARRLPAVVQD
jgi:hypothetical protein